VVVLSIEEYRLLAAHRPDFKAYLLGGPKVDDFPIERDLDTGRDVEF
jgi:antitoxin Phd